MADEEYTPYLLSATGSHQGDIKDIAAAASLSASDEEPDIYTSSRDRLVCRWGLPLTDAEGNRSSQLSQKLEFATHEGFVNFVMYHPSLPFLNGEPAIITGSNDTHVIVWNPETSFLEAVLDGHSGVVRCGCLLENGDFVSGAWDKTCVVWDGQSGKPRCVYSAHENSVMGVAPLNLRHEIISCSGDKTIRRWSAVDGSHQALYAYHKDSVQTVCVVDNTKFFSASNDATIVLWDIEAAAPLAVHGGHDSFVYSLSWNPLTEELLSASEDQTVRVWKNAASGTTATVQQAIQHPALVWKVTHLPNGDIATGCGDSQVRVWSRNFDKLASQDVIDALEAANAARTISSKNAGASGLDVSKILPAEEALTKVGSHEGEKLLAKTPEGEVEVYAWSGGHWEKIGTMVTESGDNGGEAGTISVGGAGQGGKQMHNGQAYDYVFAVDFNGMDLKLPYNSGQSVFDAAQMFINDNSHLGISQMDKEAIEQHILNNISPEDVAKVTGMAPTTSGGGGASANTFSDYAREAEELRRQGETGGVSWKEALQKMEADGSGGDVAFSTFAQEGQALANSNAGGGAGSNGNEDSSPASLINYAPQVHRGLNAEALSKKVSDLLSGATTFSATIATADAVGKAFSISNLNPDELTLCINGIQELLSSLPAGSRFPAMDLLRVSLCNREFATSFVQVHTPDILPAIVGVVCGSDATDPEVMVGLRCLTNALAASPTLALSVVTPASNPEEANTELFSKLPSLVRSKNANVKKSLCTFLDNVSLIATGHLHADAVSSGAAALTTPALRMQLAEWTMAVTGQALIFESDAAVLTKFLTPVVLLNHCAQAVCPEFEQHVVACGRKLIYAGLSPKQQYGDAVVMNVAKTLCHAFAPQD